jgi:serine/threonine protein kinase
MPNRFLASGAYGCVYYPGYDCKGKEIDKKEYITKLVLNNFSTITEYTVSEYIKKIPEYSRHFIIINKHCNISNSRLKNMIKGCKIFDKEHKKKYVLLYSKFIKSLQLCDYILENRYINKFMRVYFLLTEKLNILTEHRIVHNDLHFGNILFSTETSNLYIIDFGLAIMVDRFFNNGKLDLEYLTKCIFKFSPDWVWWSLDYHFLCYLLHSGTLTEQMIRGTIEIYLKHDLFYIFPERYMDYYKSESYKFFVKLAGMNREEGIIYLLGFWRTWDHYKIGLHLLEIIKDELHIEIPELQQKLFLFIHPNPEKRPSLLEHRILNKKMLSNSNQGYGTKVFETKVEKSRLTESIKTYKN